jgi:hypothetical protein
MSKTLACLPTSMGLLGCAILAGCEPGRATTPLRQPQSYATSGASLAPANTQVGNAWDIGNLGVSASLAPQIADDGSVGGWMPMSTGGDAAVRWTASGGLINLGTPPGCGRLASVVIGRNGDVVGLAQECPINGFSEWRGYRWRAQTGSYELLQPGPSTVNRPQSEAIAANGLGEVAGVSTPHGWWAPARWSPTSTQAEAAPVPATYTQTLVSNVSINDVGTIVGMLRYSAAGAAPHTFGFIWRREGPYEEFPLPSQSGVRIIGVDATGFVVGTASQQVWRRRPNGTIEALGDFGLGNVTVVGVSHDGSIAGSSSQGPWRWRPGSGVSRMELPATAAVNKPIEVTAMSSNGLVTGGIDIELPSGILQRPFLWLPTGEVEVLSDIDGSARGTAVNHNGQVAGLLFASEGRRWARWDQPNRSPGDDPPGGGGTPDDPWHDGHTPVGSDIPVIPRDIGDGTRPPPRRIVVVVRSVSKGGVTTSSGKWWGDPFPPTIRPGRNPEVYDIATTATYSGPVRVCIGYDPASYRRPSQIRLFHGEADGTWRNITTKLDVEAQTVCGETTSLSPFLVAEENFAPTLPALTHPALASDRGACVATFAPVTPAADDDVEGVTVAGVRSDGLELGAPYPVGATTIAWTATDGEGLTTAAPATQTVTVVDHEPPAVTAPADVAVITAGLSGTVVAKDAIGTAAVTDNCPGATVSVSDAPAGNLFPIGQTTLAWTAKDGSGNQANATQTVFVRYDVCPLYDQTKAAKLGSTVPINLRLCAADGGNLSAADVTVRATGVHHVSGDATGVLDASGNANRDLDFRYDAELGAYIFNLSTKALASGAWRMNFTVTGLSSSAYFTEFQVR